MHVVPLYASSSACNCAYIMIGYVCVEQNTELRVFGSMQIQQR